MRDFDFYQENVFIGSVSRKTGLNFLELKNAAQNTRGRILLLRQWLDPNGIKIRNLGKKKPGGLIRA